MEQQKIQCQLNDLQRFHESLLLLLLFLGKYLLGELNPCSRHEKAMS